MTQDYSEVLTRSSGSEQQERQQSFGGGQPMREPSREQVKAKLANTIGTASEAAAATGIEERQAHEIVSRAFRNAW
jgi:hypothetical protein